jgi:hypothetical protein
MAIFMGISFREQNPVWMVRERLTWRTARLKVVRPAAARATLRVPVCRDRICGWRPGRAGGRREQADGASPLFGVVAAMGA